MKRINFVMEGDSLVQGGAIWDITRRWNNALEGANRYELTLFNAGINGSGVDEMNARWGATNDGKCTVVNGTGFVPGAINILGVYCYANNWVVFTTQAQRDTWMDSYRAYFDRARAQGWLTFTFTALPLGSAYGVNYVNHNNTRAYLNPFIRQMAGVNVHAVCDVGSDAVIGTDAAGENTLYFPDGAHPSTLCSCHMGRYLEPALTSLVLPNMREEAEASPGSFIKPVRRFRILHG
jgi:hypothetical protein